MSAGVYRPLEVEVQLSPGDSPVKCRTYQMVEETVKDPLPSPQYLDVILRGAKQNGLPAPYVEKLAAFEHNGYEGPCEVYEKILKSIGQE